MIYFQEKKAHLHDVDAQNVWYCPWNVTSVSSLGPLIDENWLFHKLHGLRCAIFPGFCHDEGANKFFTGQVSMKGTLHVFVEPRYTLNLQGPIEKR